MACTNWKRVLMIATGKWKGNSALEIPADLAHAANTFQRLSNFTLPEIRAKLADYNKLIVVRHPFERLLSAYRNKFETKREKSSGYFQSRFGRKIIKVYFQIISFFLTQTPTRYSLPNLSENHASGNKKAVGS